MKVMPHTEPDSAMPTGEPASAERSPQPDPWRLRASDGCPAIRLNVVRPRTEHKGELPGMTWLGWRGGWGRKGWKCGRDKQGDPLGTERRSWPTGPKNRPAGVRASIVARKRSNVRGAKGGRKVE